MIDCYIKVFWFSQYQQEPAQLACERWLELNLVSQLAYTIQIKDLPIETLNKVKSCDKLTCAITHRTFEIPVNFRLI